MIVVAATFAFVIGVFAGTILMEFLYRKLRRLLDERSEAMDHRQKSLKEWSDLLDERYKVLKDFQQSLDSRYEVLMGRKSESRVITRN